MGIALAVCALAWHSCDGRRAMEKRITDEMMPPPINEYTSIERTNYIPCQLVEFYVTVPRMRERNRDSLDKYFAPALVRNVRRIPAIDFYREKGIYVNYYLVDEEGRQFYWYAIGPEMYSADED